MLILVSTKINYYCYYHFFGTQGLYATWWSSTNELNSYILMRYKLTLTWLLQKRTWSSYRNRKRSNDNNKTVWLCIIIIICHHKLIMCDHEQSAGFKGNYKGDWGSLYSITSMHCRKYEVKPGILYYTQGHMPGLVPWGLATSDLPLNNS